MAGTYFDYPRISGPGQGVQPDVGNTTAPGPATIHVRRKVRNLGGTKREERPSVTGIEHLDGTQIRRAPQRVDQLQLIEHLLATVTAQYGYDRLLGHDRRRRSATLGL
jgi:hypothetical protein